MKLKHILGEELYDIGPALLTSAAVIAGIVMTVLKSIKLK